MSNRLFANSELADLITKVENGERLNFADGVRLFKSNDLLAIGYMADTCRRRKNGDVVLFSIDHSGDADTIATGALATIDYGQGESIEERVGRLLEWRELQDTTGRFLVFAPIGYSIPLGQLSGVTTSGITGFEDLKALAVTRLMLDNFDHIRASLQIGTKLAQVALSFGVDDLKVTQQDERRSQISDQTTGIKITNANLIQMIQAAGRKPVNCDILAQRVTQ